MHIVVISDTESIGGAAVSTTRLLQGLCQNNEVAAHRITRVVAGGAGKEHGWQTLQLDGGNRWVRRLLKLLPAAVSRWWNQGTAEANLALLLKELRPDVINLHCLHLASSQGWTAALVDVCTQFAPTVWTFHDMWAFTGRCIYSYDCEKFVTGCDASCPTSGEYPVIPVGQIAPQWSNRQRLLQEHPSLVAVTPSRWLSEAAKRGLWKHHRVETIPYGLPLDIFAPIDRAVARTALGLPVEGLVLLSAAQDINERRKGGKLLLEAMELLQTPVTILTIGNGTFEPSNNNVTVKHLGYLEQDHVKVLAYNAADIFVHPALVDNLPNVILEAIACGTPVAGFAIGGVPDMVRPGQTGWLSEVVSGQGLLAVLQEALQQLASGVDLRRTCRHIAETEYDLSLQAARYLELFTTLQKRSGIQQELHL